MKDENRALNTGAELTDANLEQVTGGVILPKCIYEQLIGSTVTNYCDKDRKYFITGIIEEVRQTGSSTYFMCRRSDGPMFGVTLDELRDGRAVIEGGLPTNLF